MQAFFKKRPTLRLILIALCFLLGLTLVIVGWTKTGMLVGLGQEILGVIFILAALGIYNCEYT